VGKVRIAATFIIKLFNKLFLYQRPTYGTGLGENTLAALQKIALTPKEISNFNESSPEIFFGLSISDINDNNWTVPNFNRHAITPLIVAVDIGQGRFCRG
jgi:hypothetical protein